MSLANLLVHDVTIVRPGPTSDRYGDTVKDWSTATRTSVRGWMDRRSGSEVRDNREAEVSTWLLIVPVGTDIRSGDRVEYAGSTFEVDGPVHHVPTPRGVHHQEVDLRAVEG